jgi:hypothetical protein
MKIAITILSILSILMLFSTLICGLWIHNAGDKITDLASSINFHLRIGVATVIITVVTLVLVMIRK